MTAHMINCTAMFDTWWPIIVAVAFAAGLLVGCGCVGWYWRGRDHRRLAQLQDALADARKDALTGLWNRRALDEHLKIQIAIARRYAGTLSVILIDLDHLKETNDRHGHAAGDAALV